MRSSELPEKFVYPTAAVVVGTLIVTGLATTAKSALFWAIAGLVVAAIVTALVIRAFVRLGRETRDFRGGLVAASEELQAIADGLGREGQAVNELSGEVNRLRGRLALVERIAVPAWLRVAIAYNLERGGRVTAEANGLRFSKPDGVLILMVPFPLPDDDEWTEPELHKRLGITPRSYAETLTNPEPTLAAERGEHAQRLKDLSAQLDDIRALVERKGFGRHLDPPSSASD